MKLPRYVNGEKLFEEMEKEDMFILNRDTFQNGRGGQKRFECRLDLWLKQDSVQERYNQKDDSWETITFLWNLKYKLRWMNIRRKRTESQRKKRDGKIM